MIYYNEGLAVLSSQGIIIDHQLKTLTNVYSIGLIQTNTIKGLEYLMEDKYAFGLMRTLGMNNHYRDADNERLQKIEDEKRNEISTLLKLIDSSSLFI